MANLKSKSKSQKKSQVVQEKEKFSKRALPGEDYIKLFLDETRRIVESIDREKIRKMVTLLHRVRQRRGRLFFLGVGGSAANASHAVNDFRKIAGFEAYAPTDNVAELTALINDAGWENVFVHWLEESQLNAEDAIFILSIGGGNEAKKVSVNLVRAIDFALKRRASVLGIVSRKDGYAAQKADACLVIPCPSPERITPHGEATQALILHLLVSHPLIKAKEMKWEATK